MTRRQVIACAILIVGAIAANWLLGVDHVDGDTGLPTGQVVTEHR